MNEPQTLTNSHVQETLLGEAVAAADVGFLVWDEERRYVAVNRRACELLGCTLDQIIGSEVGGQTDGSTDLIAEVVRRPLSRGRLVVDRFDGSGQVELEYVTFSTHTAGLPYMASVIWEAG